MINNQLEIPNSISILCKDDPVIQDILERERKPYLIEGYAIRAYNEFPQFSFSATVNCHHSRFYTVLCKLIELVPEPIIIAVGDCKNLNDISSVYSQKQIIKTLSNYADKISNNTNIQLLFDYQNKNTGFQLFVTDCKFFEIVGFDDRNLRETMLELDLPETSNLATVAEFPRIMSSEPGAATQILLQDIINSFEES